MFLEAPMRVATLFVLRGRQGITDAESANAATGMTGSSPSVYSLQQDKALLLAQWHCLLEEKKQLSRILALSAGRLRDFEPGETPMRDVTCAVITHQLDTPCLSCCFQR
eukprot:gene7514-7724_t